MSMVPKPTRSARQLQSLIRERIDQVPELAGLPSDVDGGVIWVDIGPEGGANWTVPIRSSRDRHSAIVARIIRDVQLEFDLEE